MQQVNNYRSYQSETVLGLLLQFVFYMPGVLLLQTGSAHLRLVIWVSVHLIGPSQQPDAPFASIMYPQWMTQVLFHYAEIHEGQDIICGLRLPLTVFQPHLVIKFQSRHIRIKLVQLLIKARNKLELHLVSIVCFAIQSISVQCMLYSEGSHCGTGSL